jgi:hypothetical protein
MDEEAFCRRWQITPPESAMIFDREGRRDPDGFPIALLNLASRVGRTVWSAAIKTSPAPVLTLLLSDQRPWAHPTALARCAILIAAGEAIDVRATSEDALDDVGMTLSGLSWWAVRLGDPDPAAGASAAAWCSTILSQSGLDRTDPTVATHAEAIAEILTTIGVGGRA